MEAIRIGDKVINLAAIAYIDLEYDFSDGKPPAVEIYFIGPCGERGRDLYFDGAEAEAIRRKFATVTNLVN
jgi:hypothetical protein